MTLLQGSTARSLAYNPRAASSKVSKGTCKQRQTPERIYLFGSSASGEVGPGSATAPGSRLFRAGAIGYLVFAGVHLTTFLRSIFVAPTDPLQIEAERALRAVVVNMGPFHTHFGQLVRLLSASYSTLLLFVGVLNLVALPAAVAHRRLAALTLVNLVFCGLLLTLAAAVRFPPPMVFALIIELLFALSFVAQRRAV